MIPATVVIGFSLLYLGLLFAVAFQADKRRAAGRSIVSNSWVYALAMAVYFSSWTFYGSVGRAATVGLDFLPSDLGPTLIAFTWWFLLRKVVRISKEQNITTIADFISSRYGKSVFLGGMVTVLAIVGIMPYIALQLKAVAHTFQILSTPVTAAGETGHLFDHALLVAAVLAIFAVLFGARHLDASERHEGLVAAIALEAIVKLVAFLAVGLFVTYGLFDGFADIYTRFFETFPERGYLLQLGTDQVPYISWFSLIFMSMFAIMLLPRQFHIMVIENSSEEHIKSAMWRFPAYTFLINLFVIPIALGGLLQTGGDTAMADFFVLHLPLQTGHPWLALFVFLGGFSAAAGMVVVSSVALSTMALNHLLIPVLLKLRTGGRDLSGLLINIKRLGILTIIFLGYLYYRFFGESYALVNIGLVSFVAVMQFAPAFLGGLYWKRANLYGASVGLVLGFLLWFYTLLVPSFVRSGWMDGAILEQGLFGIGLLRPLQLFGLDGLDIWSHALFWTLFFNAGSFLALSLLSGQGEREREQAVKFVDVFGPRRQAERPERISSPPTVMEFVDLMSKFIGEKQARSAIAEFLGDAEIDARGSLSEFDLPDLKRFTERTLSGSVGAAPARIIIDNYLSARGSEMENVFDIFGSVTISRKAGREQLGVLHETTRRVASGSDLQTILDSILELLLQQFKFDLCVIRFLDPQRKILAVTAQKGMTLKHLLESEREPNLETYLGEAFVTNQVTVVNDTLFMDKPFSARVARREGITSFAHAPITIEGEPVGVISAFSRSAKGIFTEEFVELFSNLAGQVGVAWRNARQTEKLIAGRERERELQIARTIQLGLLPERPPEIRGIALSGTCLPASEVGGDYYDLLPFGEGALALVIADVSGHSVGAALTMGWLRTFIREKARSETRFGPSEILSVLNEFFYEDLTRAELFVSLAYLGYDASTRQLCYANAGHPPPLLWRAGTKKLERLDAEGMILGIKPRVGFEQRCQRLEPGDVLLLYTDGITEAENSGGVFFGEERLSALLREYHHLPPAGVIDSLMHQARLFTGGQGFRDDVSLVVMRVED